MATDVSEAPIPELVRQTLDEVRALTKAELALAKQEGISELRALRTSALLFLGAGICAVLMLALFFIALAFAIPNAMVALFLALGLLVVSGALAFLAYQRLPKRPLDDTARRIQSDVRQLKEHVT